MSSLLVRAQTDARIAHLLLSPEGNPTNDEFITDQAAYHAQQAIEKALKYQMEMLGLPYRKTHNLVGLIVDLEGAGFSISDELKQNAALFSDWEASSRYNDSFIALSKDILRALRLYDELEAAILVFIEHHTAQQE